MIKFFRKFRQRLLAENKFSKYLLYAIGEIILVVIGILIALSINNANTLKIQDANALRLSVRLLAETARNTSNLEVENAKLLIAANNSLKILRLITPDYMQLNERMVDSLMFGLYTTPKFDFNSSVLSEAISTGEVANFKSDSLKNSIYGLSTRVERLRQNEKSVSDNMDLLADLLADNYSLRKMDSRFSSRGAAIGTSQLPEIDNRKILSNRRFENLVDEHYYSISGTLIIYQELKDELIVLSKLLKEHIDIEP